MRRDKKIYGMYPETLVEIAKTIHLDSVDFEIKIIFQKSSNKIKWNAMMIKKADPQK